MAEPLIMPAGVCSNFEPQRWRRKKCKVCFHDVFQHNGRCSSNISRATMGEVHTTNGGSISSKEKLIETTINPLTSPKDNQIVIDNNFDLVPNDTTSVTANLVDDEVKLVFKTQGETGNIECKKPKQKSNGQSKEDRRERSSSFDIDEKPRKESTQQLTRLSTMDRSSNSSLNSYDAMLDEGSSSYPSYGGSRETLDSFSLNSGDLLDDATSLREKESKVILLEQEIERLADAHRATEASKDRNIQCLEREIQNLKLEIANFTARENVSILKSRLELESKSLKIHDLESELRHLHDTIEKMTVNKHFEEFDQDNLQRELTRSKNKIVTLEEEKKTLEERLTLAEDLQNNDRELLDVLRHQLTALEKDLSFCQDRTKSLEEKNKIFEKCEHDLIEERVKTAKYMKQLDALSSKLHQRDKQVNDLEDDNVRLQQLNMDYRKEINRDLEIIEKLEGKLLLRQREVDECNREVIILAAEKKKLSQQQTPTPMHNDNKTWVNSQEWRELESKLAESDRQVQDLQLENDQLIREIGDLLENLSTLNNELEECKEHVKKAERDLESFRRTRRDNERKIHSLQKKLNRVDREKKKFSQEKMQADERANYLQGELDKTIGQFESSDKSQKMLLLKLQSTEAKLAMLEGNKIYVESKLKNYKSKMKEQATVIHKFECLMDTDSDEETRDVKEQSAQYKRPVEVREGLTRESDKIISDLRNQNKEYSVSVVAMQREVLNLKEELSRTQYLNERLRYQLSSNARMIVYIKQCLENGLIKLKDGLGSSDITIEETSYLYESIKDVYNQFVLELDNLNGLLHDPKDSMISNPMEHQIKRSRLHSEEGSTEHYKQGRRTGLVCTSDSALCLKDQLQQLKEHIHAVENINDFKSSYHNGAGMLPGKGKNRNQEATISNTVFTQSTQMECGKEAGTILQAKAEVAGRPKRSRRRSISAPQLSGKVVHKHFGVQKSPADESLQVKKVITSSFHVSPETSRRLVSAGLKVGRPPLSKTASENCLVISPSKAEKEGDLAQGKFIIQAGGKGVEIGDEHRGSVLIKISPSPLSSEKEGNSL